MQGSTIVGPGLDSGDRAVYAWNLSSSADGGAGGTAGATRSIEAPNTPITWSQLAELFGGGPAGSGKVVTPDSALKLSVVWACARVISWGIAKMPLITYQRTKNGRERATDHHLYQLLKLRPHPDMSAFSARSALMFNTLMWGNGYAEIVRRGDGRPYAILPIESWRVQPFRENGQLLYRVQVDGETRILRPRDIVHIPGLSFDGVCGLSVIKYAKETIGAGLAADEFAGGLLRRGMRPSAVLSHTGRLGPEAQNRLRESYERVYGGSGNSGKPLILEEGMKYESSTMPLEDAQFVETSHFRVEDICRWFGVQPHKVQHLLRATNNNIEQQSLDFLGDTLSPWVEVTEQELNWKLFTAAEREEYYAEHLTQAIIQMDAKSRGEFYRLLHSIGGMNSDEVRDRENLNHLPDGRGQTFWTQGANMPLPNAEQADRIIEGWIKKGGGGAVGGGPKEPSEPGDEGGGLGGDQNK